MCCVDVYLLPIHGRLHLFEGGLKFPYEVVFAIRIPVPYCTLQQENKENFIARNDINDQNSTTLQYIQYTVNIKIKAKFIVYALAKSFLHIHIHKQPFANMA